MFIFYNMAQWKRLITDTFGTTKTILYMEVSLIQIVSNTVEHYCGTRTSALNRDMSVSFIEAFHCRYIGEQYQRIFITQGLVEHVLILNNNS